MMALPNGRPGQILALALPAVMAAAVWFGAVMPLADWYAEKAEILAQQRLLLRRMTALAGTIPDLQREAARPGAGPAADALLDAASDAIAGAVLQQRVQDMAGSLGINLSSIETLLPQQEGRYRRIRLRVALSATSPVLVQLLEAISEAHPQMLIDNLNLQATAILLHPNGVPLDTSFTILGFREGAAPPVGQ